jgi:uncharacterized protein (UPF0332 family)
LAGAESEIANRRYNNCANRCYYACYQAAVAALTREEIRPSGNGQWSHSAVQAQFVGQLINRRKRFAAEFRDTLSRAFLLRETADYDIDDVSEIQAARGLRHAKSFVTAIKEGAH